MACTYFSDRERGPAPRVKLDMTQAAWGGLVALINGLISNGAFGLHFPAECPDVAETIGTDFRSMGLAVGGEIPEINLPFRTDSVPPTLAVLDLLEFCHEHVADPIPFSHHSFFRHDHLRFDQEEGQNHFRQRVNRILARNQLAYELQDDGDIVRLADPVLHEVLTAQVFATGDAKLDELLDAARTKFLDPDAAVRREALEKLWDAFERVKTIEPGKCKKASVNALLDKAADEPAFRLLLEEDGKALTDVGNKFHIRHSETSQVELQSEDHVDYLFHRLFSLIWVLLQAR